MTTPTLTSNPLALREALLRIARRERLARKRASRPPLLHRLIPQLVSRAWRTHNSREHVARISPSETVHNNLPI